MKFRDYNPEKEKWITFVESDFYPNYLDIAKKKFKPFLSRFGKLLRKADNSQTLYRIIMKEPSNQRIQLLRIFRRYISPSTSIEMLKRKSKTENIIQNFGTQFRPIEEVRDRFNPEDEALIALLHEYEERGQKGYFISSKFFEWFREKFNKRGFNIEGPEHAGRDIYLDEIFEDYPKHTPVDFVIRYQKAPVVIGFCRYDSNRGGAQENDRIGGYRNIVNEILDFFKKKSLQVKVLFVNEGPGLLLGSMWNDYSNLEDIKEGDVMVITHRMLESRLTEEWMLQK